MLPDFILRKDPNRCSEVRPRCSEPRTGSNALKRGQGALNAGRGDLNVRNNQDVNKPKLLILDELGYIPFTPLQGQLLFELISARYEKKSIIVTSNKMPGEWGTVFGDAAAATASLDRLLHHCTPMLIQGESYRTRAFTRKMRE